MKIKAPYPGFDMDPFPPRLVAWNGPTGPRSTLPSFPTRSTRAPLATHGPPWTRCFRACPRRLSHSGTPRRFDACSSSPCSGCVATAQVGCHASSSMRARICRKRLPVKQLSASCRVKYRACRMRRPPVLNSRCWRLASDQLWMAKTLDIREAVIARRSPWQNAYAERVIGSIRRECLAHVVVIGERHLLWIPSKYVEYYYGTPDPLILGQGRTRATECAA